MTDYQIKKEQKQQKKQKEKKTRKLLSWMLIAVMCVIFAMLIYWCNHFQRKSLTSTEGQSYEKGEVVSIVKDNLAEDGERYGQQEVMVRMKSGSLKGKTIDATSPSGTLFGADCTEGMKVIVLLSTNQNTSVATIYSQDRTIPILVFLTFFILVVCFIGGMKGVKAILGLIITVIGIFGVFLPLIYRGISPVVTAIVVCFFATIISLVLLGGICRKTVSAIVGTTIGVTIAGLSALFFGKIAGISGYNVSDIETLSFVAQNCPIKIGELLFAGIIISSLGAVMDVGMSISSTIQEIHETNPLLTRKQLFLSGIHVGRDMMGTMTNTLILAYAGGSITTLFINYAYKLSVNQLMNSYNIGIEIMQGISGSLGIVLTVPVTAFLASFFVHNKNLS